MALTIVATVGSASANSFVTEAEQIDEVAIAEPGHGHEPPPVLAEIKDVGFDHLDGGRWCADLRHRDG